MIDLISSVEGFCGVTRHRVYDRNRAPQVVGSLALVRDPQFGLIRIERRAVGSDTRPIRPDNLARFDINLGSDRATHDGVDVFLRRIDHRPVGPVTGDREFVYDFPGVRIDLCDPERAHGYEFALVPISYARHTSAASRRIASRFHERVDVLVVLVGPDRVEEPPHIDVTDTAENFIVLGVVEDQAQAVRVACEHVEQDFVTKNLPMVESCAYRDLCNML